MWLTRITRFDVDLKKCCVYDSASHPELLVKLWRIGITFQIDNTLWKLVEKLPPLYTSCIWRSSRQHLGSINFACYLFADDAKNKCCSLQFSFSTQEPANSYHIDQFVLDNSPCQNTIKKRPFLGQLTAIRYAKKRIQIPSCYQKELFSELSKSRSYTFQFTPAGNLRAGLLATTKGAEPLRLFDLSVHQSEWGYSTLVKLVRFMWYAPVETVNAVSSHDSAVMTQSTS